MTKLKNTSTISKSAKKKFKCKACKREFALRKHIVKHSCVKKTKFYEFCEFCNVQFINEKLFLNHTCRLRKRYLRRDDSNIIMGYKLWKKAHLTIINRNTKKVEYRNFIESRFYNSFVDFGEYVIKNNLVEPIKYVDYLLKENIKLNQWNNEPIYAKYIKIMMLKEDPYVAVTRSIEFMANWAKENRCNFNEFYENSNTNIAINNIRNGQISPWLIYISENSDVLLSRFDESQVKLIEEYMKPAAWSLKLKKHKHAVNELRELLKEQGL